MSSIQLSIITGEREVYSDEVDVVVAPGVDGDLGILPHHAALMTMLKPGELMIRKGREEEFLAVTGGFLEVLNNNVTILADACERSEEIDEERSEDAIERAKERLAAGSSDVNLEQSLLALRRAEVRTKVARRRRIRRGAVNSQ